MPTRLDLIDTFSRRPRLSSVATTALKTELDVRFPASHLDPDSTRVVGPPPDTGETLVSALHWRFATGKTLRWRSGVQTLVTAGVNGRAPIDNVDVEQLAELIDSVALELPRTFAQAVIAFWDRAEPGSQSPALQLAERLEQQARVESGSIEGVQGMDDPRRAFNVLDAQVRAILQVCAQGLADFDDIERYIANVTDISPLLDDFHRKRLAPHVSRLDQLPTWLSSASARDRLDFSERLTALAVTTARAGGRSWDDDLPPIQDYARKAMQDELRKDHPEASHLTLDDVTVHIAKVVAAAVPSAGQIIATGSIEPVRMSVAAFALGNLASLPPGTLTLTLADGGPLPAWLTPDYLKDLVSRVNIGEVYPARVRHYLISDRVQAARRKRLFADQLKVQLPLKALEQKLRQQGQLTESGYRMVCSLLDEVPDRDVVLRPLGFLSAPDARPDEVCNMFVIGPSRTDTGPFILYRPFAQLPLSEYATWTALRDAVVSQQDLQDEVLAWMTEHGRGRYANGGFEAPHIVRFGLGSDFAPLQTPAPAQLSAVAITGDVMQVLFDTNANALVTLADRQSVSNAESRWSMIQRGGWLTLEVVLPFLNGGVAMAVWLVQLMSAADRVLAVDRRKADSERIDAWNALLVTLAMVLLHGRGRPSEASAAQATESVGEAPTADAVGAEALSAQEALDFSWSALGRRLTADQAEALQRLKLVPEPELGLPSTEPGREGLYRHGQQWRVKLDSGVYRVAFVNGEVRVVAPQGEDLTGPLLRRDGQHWVIDLSLKLRGGGPKRNARLMAQENAATLRDVTERDALLVQRKLALYDKFVGWGETCRRTDRQLPPALYDLIETDLNALIAVFEERDQLQRTLRVADRLGDKTMAADLQGVVRRIAFLESVLAQKTSKLARGLLEDLRAGSDGMVAANNVDAYLKLFEDMAALQDRGVHWSEVRDRLWQRLRQIPKVGEAYWRDEVLELQQNGLMSPLEWRIDRMWSLLELSFTPEDILSGLGDQRLKALRTDEALHEAVSSQAELERPNDYTPAAQIDVLESSLREYERCALIMNHAKDNAFETLDTVHYQRFFDAFNEVVARAEHRLSSLVRDSAEPPEKPVVYVPAIKQPRKRVIKTRGHRTLVGRVREGESELPGAVVDIIKGTDETVVSTYHLHDNGEWVEAQQAQPSDRPVAAVLDVALSELHDQARVALGRVEANIASARRLARRPYEPADIQDMLATHADSLSTLADRLVAKREANTAHTPADAFRQTVEALRSSAARLRDEGRALRIAMIKAQPPTAARLSYLAHENEIDIARYDGRKNMSGSKRNDFLQEYVIRDKQQRELWWAHFHYASEDAGAAAFLTAHLKLPAQRFVGYKAQVRAAKTDSEVVSIYRSRIGMDVAQRLFLPLAR
ncbi:hypothetical protein N5D61_25725 [Pseudomonas sp. GD03842]|uniref:dermonecrotic toxin domain-containing protein n=1 Tax=Pseudomonas sp. GD03842 TaxID=2975385 RepID=UPI002449947E|nr:DUF6543 domain-containing protein [Pseudomonas sp. GD03842]MDH0749732.1 hypothetical protein [Pseudomonas sp. GD03842]